MATVTKHLIRNEVTTKQKKEARNTASRDIKITDDSALISRLMNLEDGQPEKVAFRSMTPVTS